GSIIRAVSLIPPGTPALKNPVRPAAALAQRPVLSGATLTDLTTLKTPAAKPSRKNTMSPQGDVDSKRSKPQPIPAPTTTPAINSEERRRPRAIAEALAAPSPLPLVGWSVLILRLSRISDNRWSRLPSLAESAASSGDLSRLPSPLSSVPSAMLRRPATKRVNGNDAPSPSKAARTILTTSNQVKIAA